MRGTGVLELLVTEAMAIVLATKRIRERTMGNRGLLSSFAFVSDSDASLKWWVPAFRDRDVESSSCASPYEG